MKGFPRTKGEKYLQKVSESRNALFYAKSRGYLQKVSNKKYTKGFSHAKGEGYLQKVR